MRPIALCILLQRAEQEVRAEQPVMGLVLSSSGLSSTAAVGTLVSARRQLLEGTEHSMRVQGSKQLVGGCLSAMHGQCKRELVGSSSL